MGDSLFIWLSYQLLETILKAFRESYIRNLSFSYNFVSPRSMSLIENGEDLPSYWMVIIRRFQAWQSYLTSDKYQSKHVSCHSSWKSRLYLVLPWDILCIYSKVVCLWTFFAIFCGFCGYSKKVFSVRNLFCALQLLVA